MVARSLRLGLVRLHRCRRENGRRCRKQGAGADDFRHDIAVMRTLFQWDLGTRKLALGQRTLLMGIVNVTPDSFSDGGLYLGAERAVEHALRLLDEGADIIDIGGESTRPGAAATVSAQQELDRILPVIQGVRGACPE